MTRLIVVCALIFLSCCSVSSVDLSHDNEIDSLCKSDNPTMTEKMNNELHHLEKEFNQTDEAAKKKLDALKSQNALEVDEFEKEYQNFLINYKVILNVMKLRPTFCERLIEELDEAIKHFYKRASH